MNTKWMLLPILSCLLAAPVAAVERGTPDEAKAMLAKAVAHYEKVGREQALADFSAKKLPFGDRDLYVVCIGPDHTVVAHGALPKFVGSSSDVLKDADGKPLGKSLWDAAQAGGSGSVHYRWQNPMTGQIEQKVSFVQKAGSDVCLVGAYTP